MYSRIYKQIIMERNRRIREANQGNREIREEESARRARSISGREMHIPVAADTPPKAVRWGLGNINFQLPGAPACLK